MIRRAALAAIVLTIAGGVATPAFADLVSPSSATTGGPGVCILGTNHTNGTRDGICIQIPMR